MVIDMSLNNTVLYSECRIEEVAGRKNLVTPPGEAISLVGRNIQAIVQSTPPEERREIVLSGGMAIWAYLVVFHSVVHTFDRVYYDDGRGSKVLVAAHG